MTRLQGLTLTIVCCCVLFPGRQETVFAQTERTNTFIPLQQTDKAIPSLPEERRASGNDSESFPAQTGHSPFGFLLFISLQILIILALWRNIARRKQAEKDLLFSKERFNQAMRATQDGLFDWNLETNEIYYSPGWKRMLGYGVDELDNDFSVWERLTEPGDVKKSFEMLQEHIDGKRDRFEIEFKMLHKDGHWVDVFSRANAVFDRHGKALRVVGTHVDITDPKHAQEALNESEKLLSAVFNSTSDLQMVVHVGLDEALRIHAVNQAYIETAIRSGVKNVQEQLLGKTLEEAAVVLGQDLQGLDETIQRYRQSIASGTAVTYIESTTVLNQSLHAEITLSPILDARNHCQYVLYDSHNVTEAQNALYALQESEARFKELFDTISSGVAVYRVRNDGQYGKDYIIENFNKASLLQEDMEKKDVIGKSLFDLRPNIDAYGLIPIFREVWKTGNPAFFPAKMYVDDKYANYYENRVFRLPDGEIVAVYDDVTERKRGEEALKESEEKYRTVVQAVPDRISTVDAEGTILFMNRPFPGYSIDELTGTCFYEYMPADQREPIQAFIRRIFADKQSVTHEHPATGDPDGLTWYSTCGAPLLRDGEVIAVTLISRDISERKQAEDTLQQLNIQLEDRVKKRTERLEHANKALNDFAHIVSHDLKAPLRGIARLSEWIAQDYGQTLDADGKQMLQLLREQVLRMDKLINGILRYSRAGRHLERIEAIDIGRLLEAIIGSIVPSDRTQVSLAHDLPTVFGDAIRLEQVFQNLLSNAVKFMDNADGEITIRSEEHGEYWLFSVSDNGSGIDEAHHERIFQMFQTLKPSEDQQNTGIGLALVKKIIELHGGRVWVESQIGSGSTFYFTLPKDLSHALY